MSDEPKSLITLVSEMDQWNKAIIQAEGEISPEIEALLEHTEKDLAQKVDSYDHVLQRLELEEAFWDEKAKFYKMLSSRFSETRDKLKERIKFAMQTMGVTELKGIEKRIKISPTKGRIETNEDLDPAYKMLVTPPPVLKPDTERLRQDLELGVSVKGAQLIPGFQLRVYANKVDQKPATDKKVSTKTKEVTNG